jgi:hypothetical protein
VLPARWGSLTAALLESFDSGLPYEAVGFLDPRAYVANPGYMEPPRMVMYFFTKPGSFRTDDITRTDLALTCTLRLFRNAELFVRPEVLNLFNEQGVVAVNSTVCPSGGAFETYSAPILPVAPGRLSVITATFQRAASRGPNTRDRMSAPVPGVYGTTMVTVRDGKPASWAAAALASSTAASPAQSALRLIIMFFLLV